MKKTNNIFKNKRILVTGGTGFIGSEIVRQLLKYDPEVIRVLSNDEHMQYEMEKELPQGPDTKVRYLLGDIRDLERLKRAIEDINFIFHAAALKHVRWCEYDPFEAIQTNITGTQNVIKVALGEKSVEKVILISTDKAVNPNSTMGTTKLLAEKLMSWATFYRKVAKPIFTTVRFGNVINSRGSVIPLFKEQIIKKGPVTITDKEMSRFLMSVKSAVNLVLKSATIAKGGEIFVLKMPIAKITDIADVMIKELAPKYNYDPNDININYIGSYPGEKMNESLMTEEEVSRTIEMDDMYVILPQQAKFKNIKSPKTFNKKILTKDEIKEIMKREKIL